MKDQVNKEVIGVAYKQARMRKRRLERSFRRCGWTYYSGLYYDSDKGRLVKRYINVKKYKIDCRKSTRKALKRKKDEFQRKGSNYKKLYDYKWTIV